MHKVNCIYNDQGAWCNNENVKRILCGIGTRCCIEFGSFEKTCKYRKEYTKPPAPPPPPQKRVINEDIKPVQWVKEKIMNLKDISRKLCVKAQLKIIAEKDLEMEKFAEEHRQRTSQEIKAWRQGE